ncbi:hypothetical protein B0F90DRAFT_1781230 [Multifurca ochricompacta]|uniref:Uncharacterized protein n=1 Tax=Multifurca ochricompacta TaxID=376703 RepID=A0AAD4LVD7_9AGAM|nr:hypothetical protein B0F90DRAFT_1781230 [Multifurca ochricompacta]
MMKYCLWNDTCQPWRRSPLRLVIRKCTLKRGFQSELLYAMSQDSSSPRKDWFCRLGRRLPSYL